MTQLPPDQLPPAKPAATLILFRDAAEGPPELLLVERSTAMVFAGGAIVFPGGRVEEDDLLLASRHPHLDAECAAARIAAIRETIEESGIPIALVGDVPQGWLEEVRAALQNQAPFSALLDAANLALDLEQLRPFARWRPQLKGSRTYDTRFFIARAPDDLPDAIVDATENVRTFWRSAQATIDATKAGEGHVVYPTARNLERVAQFSSFDEACSHIDAYPLDMISPWLEDVDGTTFLCIPEGMGYPVTRESLETARRGGVGSNQAK